MIDHHIKFREDRSFRCGDICKTIRAFVWSLIFNAFCIYSWFEHQNSLKIERLSKSCQWFFNAKIKMETYQQKIPYNKSFNQFLFIPLYPSSSEMGRVRPSRLIESKSTGIILIYRVILGNWYFLCSYYSISKNRLKLLLYGIFCW